MFNLQESNQHILIYELEEGETPDLLSASMLQNRPLPGFLPVGLPFPEEAEETKDTESVRFLVPIADKLRLPEYLAASRCGEAAEDLFSRLADAVVAAEKELKNAMIPQEEWLFDLRFVYVDRKTEELFFLCLPTKRVACLQNSVKDFFRLAAAYLVTAAEESRAACALLQYCNKEVPSNEAISDSAFLEAVKNKSYLQAGLQEEMQAFDRNFFCSPAEEEPEKIQKRTSFREKVLLFFTGKEAEEQAEKEEAAFAEKPDLPLTERPFLICRRTGERFFITEDTAFLGKSAKKITVRPKNAAAAEEEQARIFCFQGTYFLEDLNSVSGTWLNSIRLDKLEERELHSADVIRTGGEELIFINPADTEENRQEEAEKQAGGSRKNPPLF